MQGLKEMVKSAKKTTYEVPIVSADPARAPVFPSIFVECEKGFSEPIARAQMPDAAQINANGGLKNFLEDAKSTYRTSLDAFREVSRASKMDEGWYFLKYVKQDSDAILSVADSRESLERRNDYGDLWQAMALKESQWMVQDVVKLVLKTQELRSKLRNA